MARESEKVHPKHPGIYVAKYTSGATKYAIRPTVGGHQQRLEFHTLKEARQARDQIAGVHPKVREQQPGNRRIDREFLDHVLEYLQVHREDHCDRPNLGETTIHGYRKTVSSHLDPWLRTHRWRARTVTLADFKQLCDHVGQGGNAAYTNTAKFCQVLGRTLVELNFRQDNPAQGLNARSHRRSTRTAARRRERQHGTGSDRNIPDWDIIEQVLTHVRNPLHRIWFQFLALTGLRPEEAAGLQWDRDVDLDRGFLLPNEPLVEVNGRRILLGVDVNAANAAGRIERARHQHFQKAGKNPRWLRPIPLTDDLRNLLTELHDGHSRDGIPWLFPGGHTSAKARASVLGSFPLSYEHTQTVLREAGKAAGVPGLCQYDLRHYLASVMVVSGLSYEMVAKTLGNSAKIVEDTYSHLRHRDVEDLGQRISEALAADRSPTPPDSVDSSG